jgi:glycine cleavage system H protein
MPNLLSKVKADVLSINPYAQTPGMISVDPVESAARVVRSVRASGADLGAVIDAGGEHLTLVDGTGRILSDDEALMVFLDLVTAGDDPVRVALPATVSLRAYNLCAERGAEVITTALSSSRLMEAAASGGVAYAADQDGGFIFPDFLPSFDGAAALVNLIALLGRSGESLAQVVARVPDLPIMRTEVETPFEQKGLVMRTLMEQLAEEDSELVLIDGIKVLSPTGWVLVVPDPEEPTTHVWAEGVDLADSERLSSGYVERLRLMLSGGDGSRTHRRQIGGVRRLGRPLASPPMDIPDDLRYSVEHEWVRTEGGRARVGITDYAQDALGDIVYVELPTVGTELAVGAKLGEVESTKSVSEIYSPVAGTVAAVNDALPDSPERINSDPYGEGWICELELADPGGLEALLDAAAYSDLTAG